MTRILSDGLCAVRIQFVWRSLAAQVGIALCMTAFCATAHADRIVLAPRGLVLSPGTAKLELASMLDRSKSNVEWLNVGIPDDALGLELEVERGEFGSRRRTTFSAQYSLTGNALSDIAPAVSVGVRDAANRGREGMAFFVAMTKTMGLSQVQEQLVRDWKLHLGYGTSHMDGLYIGLQAKARAGFSISSEYYCRKVNLGISWPIVKQLSAQTYSLNGNVYYGILFTVAR